jgi:hypothetical protein
MNRAPRTIPEPADVMEARLIEEIVQLQAQLGLDLRNPATTASLRAVSTEALGRIADAHENLAHLYCRAGRPPRPATSRRINTVSRAR